MSDPFESFVAEIRKLAEADGVEGFDELYQPEDWRPEFNEGLSPADAWAEEVSCVFLTEMT